MKRAKYVQIGFLALIMATANVIAADAQAGDALELRCRGGSDLHFVVVDGRTTSTGDRTAFMTVDFKPASMPSGLIGRNLQPGQCSFGDRALRPNEPNEIIEEIIAFGQLKEKLHGSAVDNSPTAAERFPDSKNVPIYMADPSHYWSFFVRQNGPLPSGRFESSYGRYWKPGSQTVRPYDDRNTKKISKPPLANPKKP